MKRIIIPIFFALAISQMAQAQDVAKIDTSWKKGGFVSLSFNQVSLTNWAAGGENALSGTFIGNFFANYKKEKAIWDNTLDVGYGMLKSGDAKVRKNEDKIELNSKYGHEAFDHCYYSALINAKTQFAPGYTYPNDSVVISRFAAPAYLTVALGMDYKPTDYFSLFLSPATGRLVIVADQKLADEGQFGVDPATYDVNGNKLTNGKQIRTEFGAYLRARFQKDIFKNVNLLSTLNLFNNYTDKIASRRGNINVDWQTMLNMKVGKWLTFSVFTHLLYDNNIDIPTYEDVIVGNVIYKNTVVAKGPKLQFKEVLGVGISWKF
jgi:hypothetical protein